jgi:NADH-quinone oxidoreductase subunit N
LLRSCPGLTICFSIMLLGLFGIPPLSGFLGKFAIFAALTDAFRATGSGYLMFLLLLGGINTAISLFYYLRVIRVMTLAPEAESPATATSLPILSAHGLYILVLTLPTAFLILQWERLNAVILSAARSLFT